VRRFGVASLSTTVTLEHRRAAHAPSPCPIFTTPQQPENGVQVDSGLAHRADGTLSFSDHCLVLAQPDCLPLQVTGVTRTPRCQ